MEYVFIFRTTTDGHGDCQTAHVKAASPADAWQTFHEQHANVVWTRLDTVRRPLW